MVNFSNSAVTLLISGLFSSASFAAEFSLSSPDLQPGQAQRVSNIGIALVVRE
nr:hypothetical protein [Ningiella sp. W23]